MSVRVALVPLLVTGIVGFLVVVFLEVSVLGVILVVLLVGLAFAHTLLVRLVFRIILVVILVLRCRRRRCPHRASGDAAAPHYCQNPDTFPYIHLYSHTISPPSFVSM